MMWNTLTPCVLLGHVSNQPSPPHGTHALSEYCAIHSISPTAGPTRGGTLVNLTGTALGDGSTWRCSFGMVMVGAEYFDDTERVGCFSPPLDIAARVHANVSIDGGSSFCSGEMLPFQYYSPPHVSAISPASGSIEGGTVITVIGSGFGALTSDRVVCTFGRLRVDNMYHLGTIVGTISVSDDEIQCIAPNADAAAAVGSASFEFDELPKPEVLQDCEPGAFVGWDGCVPGVEPERLHRFPDGHNVTLLGDALHEGRLIKLTRNRLSEVGSMILTLYSSASAAGVPVRDFDASWNQLVGRGSGADGYSFVYADLSAVHTGWGEMGVGDGLIVRFRTHGFFREFNEGHGVIEALYNNTVLNSTFMGYHLRTQVNEFGPQAVRVRYGAEGLVVSFEDEVVLATRVPAWTPQVGWAFGWGARTGDRKDDHWIDDVYVQSGYLLDIGEVEFGVSLNDGHDVTLLSDPSMYKYTSKPAVFSFSPTTGPEAGNTTVAISASHLAGGADYRCHFGVLAFGDDGSSPTPSERVTRASYEQRKLLCASPSTGRTQLVPLEVSLNNRLDSTSTSAVPFRFYHQPHLDDASGPQKVGAPAGVGANVSLLGTNFSGGDDYRVAFSQDTPGLASTTTVVPATFINDSLVLAVAPSFIDSGLAMVALTLNGQQYTAPTRFPFFAVHSLSPNTGPARGGTLVSVNGTAFDSGGDYRCRYADAGETEGSRVDDETLICYSPPAALQGGRPLEVALNARDFSASNVTFGFYMHPTMASVYPSNGPTGGETTVAVRSVASGGLDNGSHYGCRFGAEPHAVVVPATYVDKAPPIDLARGPHLNSELLRPAQVLANDNLPSPTPAELYLSRQGSSPVVHGTEDPHGAVLCVAPPNVNTSASGVNAATDTLRVPFAVSLNGQNYHSVHGGYIYFHPPNLTELGPLRGPASGGTTLTLVVTQLHEAMLNSTSCRVGGPGHALPFVHSRPVKAFMARVVAIAPGVVQCNVPAARRAGALGSLRVDFGSAAGLSGSVFGDATLVENRGRPCGMGPSFSCGGGSAVDASATSARCEWLCPVADGALQLTSGEPFSSGAYLLATPHVTLAPKPLEFNLTFELLIGRENRGAMAPHGDGSLTINYGRLPDHAFGMAGLSLGLALQLIFASRQPVLEVWLEGIKLLETPLVHGARMGVWVPCAIEVAQRSLSLEIARRRLVDRLGLPGWDPQPDWRFGFTASNSRQRDEFWLDSVELTTATLLSFTERTVELTLNGQQYVPLAEGNAGRFGYYGAARFPVLVGVSPSSGPVEGGTILRLSTSNVDGNLTLLTKDPRTFTTVVEVDEATAVLTTLPAFSTSAYRCFLGADNLTAKFINSTIRCVTSPFLSSAVFAPLPLNFSVNAQDPSGPLAAFTVYGVVSITHAFPLSGPTSGGTIVVFEGANFANGSDYRCRFGNGLLVNEFPGADVSFASYDAQGGAIRCASPVAVGGEAGPVPLFVSLNSQNYVRAAALNFHYTEPLRPHAVSPTSGPIDGDTSVSVSFSSSLVGAFAPRCRFGAEVVDAIASDGHLRCVSPPATLAPAATLLRLLWTPLAASSPNDLTPADWMDGDASEQSDGAILLTNNHAKSYGSIIVPPGALNASALSHSVFRVSLELKLWNGFTEQIGDGFSVSYGLLPPGRLGDYGGGLGLRVCFLTASACPAPDTHLTCPSLVVYYATERLWIAPLAEHFRQDDFKMLIVEYTSEGLHVSHEGVTYVPRGQLFIPDWAPAPGWSVGLGARSGLRVDFHWVRRVQIEMGALVDASHVPLHVSLNAQQYEPVPDVAPYNEQSGYDTAGTFRHRTHRGVSLIRQYTHGRHVYERGQRYTYYGAPNVTVLSPASGPAVGGPPALMLAGTGRHTPGGLHGGSHYRCRFGDSSFQFAEAVLNDSDDQVYCVAPAGHPAAAIGMAVSLNGQQYHAAPSTYARLAWAEAIGTAIASPNSGPLTGGTLVTVRMPIGAAASLAGGDDYRCRFADEMLENDTRTIVFAHEAAQYYRVTPATYDAADGGSVRCYSPPVLSAHAVLNATLQLSPNARHFEMVAPYEFYQDAVVSSMSPNSGPIAGATTLRLSGRGLSAGSHAQCWLGSGRSNASLALAAMQGGFPGQSELQCVAPPGLEIAETHMRVALNGQQASCSVPFTFYEMASLYEVMPNHGDAASSGINTLVRVRTAAERDDDGTLVNGASSFVNGSDYRCRFDDAIQPATLVANGEVRCHAPVGAPRAMALRVALNGQQYGPAARFDLLEAPQVYAVEPSSGLSAGGAVVDVAGTGFANRSLLACRFGGPMVDVSGTGFASATVPGTFVSASTVRCVAPSADAANLGVEWRTDFDDGLASPRLQLLGNATIVGGSAVLATGFGQSGSLTLEPSNYATTYFRARFHAIIGSGLGGDGLSFCYGALPLRTPFGEEGVPEGLCVRLRTHPAMKLEIVCSHASGESLLTSASLGVDMRSGSFQAVSVERAMGRGVRATFELGANASVAELAVPEAELAPLYAPTLTWRFGFGARSGRVPDVHMIDSLSITSAAFVESASVAVGVANNGQQFSASQATFEFYVQPKLSVASPTSGPLGGATRVHVYGAHLSRGHATFCRFAQLGGPALPPCTDFTTGVRPLPMPACTGSDGGLVVNASRLPGGDGLVCLSPYTPAAVLGPLEVSLNGQQYTRAGRPYDTLGVPTIAYLSPSCGPTDGLTRVSVSGGALDGGSHRLCKLVPSQGGVMAARTVNASRTYGDASVLCSTPHLPTGVSNLSVTPNAQQYSQPFVFDYYVPPVVSSSSPYSGPTNGGTVVVLTGRNLASGPRCDVVCSFGGILAAGTASASEGSIVCQAPRNPAADGAILLLLVSLNRQQFSAGTSVFSYTSASALSEVVPSSGPVLGSTTLLVTAFGNPFVNASGLGGGDDYTCRFVSVSGLAHVVNATYLEEVDKVTCIAPPVGVATAGAYNLSVSLNRQNYRRALPYVFYPSPQQNSVCPTSGPIAGGTILTIRGTHLGGGNNYTCRFGDLMPHLIVPASHNQGDDAVRCTTPHAASACGVSVRVAPNAQQYAPVGTTFELHALPPAFSIWPESGPELGGINVTVAPSLAAADDSCGLYANDGVCDEPWVCRAGTDCTDCSFSVGSSCGLRAGSDHRCRFFAVADAADDSIPLSASVPASVRGATLVCRSPPTNVSIDAGGTWQVAVTLNGQQYTAHTRMFYFYTDPIVSAALPLGGPVLGGTTIVVSGVHLDGGFDYRCELGVRGMLLPAVYDRSNGTVVCGPTQPGLQAGTHAVSVLLNSEDRAFSSAASFQASAAPKLFAISPSSGPLGGNTTVLFSGTAFVNSSAAAELRCRFGTYEVPASFRNAEQLACTAPDAADAGASSTLTVDFTDEENHDVDTALLAPAMRSTSSGVLLLGEALLRPVSYMEPFMYVRLTQSAFSGPGALLFPSLAAPHAGAPWFHAKFDLRLWGSGAAHGLSFCYGELPLRAWGEDGASLGLCLLMNTMSDAEHCFDTCVYASDGECDDGSARTTVVTGSACALGTDCSDCGSRTDGGEVRILLGGEIVHVAPAYGLLRRRYWLTARVVHSRSLGGLHFEIDGNVLLDGVPLPAALAPTASWRFGFGARTGPNPTQLEERHDVRLFRATVGVALGPQVVPVQLTLNGQQYVGFTAFTYYANAAMTSVAPVSGPTAGGTALLVSGLRLHGGSDYRCRFAREGGIARVVRAVLVVDAVACNSTADPLISATLEFLSVSLNGQQYITDDPTLSPALIAALDVVLGTSLISERALNFSAHAAPMLTAISPSSGPALGGTLVSLHLAAVEHPTDHTCRFGFAAADGGLVDVSGTATQAILGGSLVQCFAPAVRLPYYESHGSLAPTNFPQISLEYSLNGQQFTVAMHPFTYYDPTTISIASPNSGPIDGGTRVIVHGHGLWGKSGVNADVRCAFGDDFVPASRMGVGGAGASDLVCVSPVMVRLAGPTTRPLRVSLNGQQFSPPLAGAFEVYHPPIISALSPSSGPATDGGTVITVSGSSLERGGSHLQCVYYYVASADEPPGGLLMQLDATRLPSGELRCASPADLVSLTEPLDAPDAAATVRLAVSFNGQQLSNASAFRSFRPHNLTELKPRSGSYLGGTSVSLTLATTALDTNTPNAPSADTMRCRFGTAVVPASRLGASAEHVRCISPSSVAAGALPRRFEEFNSLPIGSTLFGSARLRGGVVQLTSQPGFGVLALKVPNGGGSTLTIAFDLILGTGSGADGVSIVYGPPTTEVVLTETGTALTEGVGVGLHPNAEERRGPMSEGIEIWVRTGLIDLLQVAHRGRVVTARPMNGALRASAFLNGTLAVSADGELEISLGAGVLVESVVLEGWAPRAAWRLAFGGRCSSSCASPENAQWLDNLVIHSDALVQTAGVVVALALNGQQFYGVATFVYNADLHISAVWPTQGPSAGSTQLTLAGSNFEGGASYEYTCRFGIDDATGWSVVPGTLFDEAIGGGDAPSWALRCDTPAAPALTYPAASLALQVSSNGQEYSRNASIPFKYYLQPFLELVIPTGGPTHGGTMLRVFGAHLHAGTSGQRRCRVGAGQSMPASFDATSGALVCATPAVTGLGASATLSVRIALNVEHFDIASTTRPTFEYYAPPRLDSVEPSFGFSSRTVVTLRGHALWREEVDGTPTTLCRFGNALVNATRDLVDANAVRCVAPPAAVAGAWSRVALSFDEPWFSQLHPFEAHLRGTARVGSGYLHLVDADHGIPGSPSLRAPHLLNFDVAGSIVVALAQPALAPRHFRTRFQLRMGRGGGGGGGGVSFSYGDLPSGNLGELGGGRGLRVCFRTYEAERHRVEVWHDGLLLHASFPFGDSLRVSSDFVDVLIQYDDDGLTLDYAGRSLARGLRMPRWAPRTGWRFAIGARSGGRSDDHHVDEFVIEAGSAVTAEAVRVAVTLNGLQFTEEALQFEYLPETAHEARWVERTFME